MFRYGSSALHLTAAFNNPSAAAVLLDNGAVVDLGDFRLRTPLHFAAMHESLEATSVLLAAGADRHAVDDDGLEPHEMVPAGSDDGRAGRAGKGEAAAVRRAVGVFSVPRRAPFTPPSTRATRPRRCGRWRGR